MRVALAVCLVLAALPFRAAAEWPQWRGPGANGRALGTGGPEHWSPASGLRWRAPIEGAGLSTPAVDGDRIYVTTAVTEERRSVWRGACDVLIAALAIVGLPWLVVRHGRRAGRGTARWLDRAALVPVAVVVAVLGVALAAGPAYLDGVLHPLRDSGVALARALGRRDTNLSFLTWGEAAPHNRWIVSTAIALLSLGLAPFCVPPASRWRLAGGAALLGGIAASARLVPWPPAYGDRAPWGGVVALFAPVAALALFHLVQYLRGLRGEPQAGGPALGAATAIPALLACALFLSPNVLPQSETVVTRRLISLDASSGARVWSRDVFTTRPETTSPLNSHATPSPSVSGGTVVAGFGVGVAAFSRDGDPRWSRTVPGWIDGSIYGAGSSPVINAGAVFVTDDREYEAARPSRVAAYALETGREMWRQSPEFAHDGYATPLVVDDGRRRLLLTLTSRTLAAFVASSGDVAWRLRVPIDTPIPSLLHDDGRLYLTGGLNGEGVTAAYRLRPGEAPEALWSSRRNPSDVSSPVLYRGRLYTITSSGIMVCYDAESGEIRWRHRVGAGDGVFYASLLAAGGRIYAVSSAGTTYVVEAGDTFRLVAASSLEEDTYASPALAGGCLLLRTSAALYCIGAGASPGTVGGGG